MCRQAALHYSKYPDERGRRPGFPARMHHVLALVVSFKLEGAFDYASSSWSGVLWPLWAIAGFFGMALCLAACCGLPIVLRRSDVARGHLGCLFSAGLLLFSSIFFPAVSLVAPPRPPVAHVAVAHVPVAVSRGLVLA